MAMKIFYQGCLLDYKSEIRRAGIDRRELADALGITYSQLSTRLSEFTPWQRDEERNLQKILSDKLQQKGFSMDEKQELTGVKTALLRRELGPVLAANFGPHADLILEHGIADGSISIAPSGVPCVIGEVPGEIFVGGDAISALRARHPKLAVGNGDASGGKTLSLQEYTDAVAAGKSEEMRKFIASGGRIVQGD
jgi:hypothetical protein